MAFAGFATPAPGRSGLDLQSREGRLTAIVRMRGSADDRLIIGWVIGKRYAVVNHRAVPMLGILAGTFARYQRLDKETYTARALEVAFFTDLATGELLERWKNPVTGALVDVPQTRMGPSTILVTADRLQIPQPVGEASGLEIEHRFLDPVEQGGEVWFTEEIRVFGAPRRPGGQPFAYNENSTYRARRSDLDNPALAAVPVQVDFQSLVTFRPWMGFGDTPGHTLARGAGGRALRIEDLPSQYLELARQHHPDVLADPLAALAEESATGS